MPCDTQLWTTPYFENTTPHCPLFQVTCTLQAALQKMPVGSPCTSIGGMAPSAWGRRCLLPSAPSCRLSPYGVDENLKSKPHSVPPPVGCELAWPGPNGTIAF